MAVEILENTLLKLLVRRGTDSDRRNIVLSDGELGYTTDTERLFVGNSTDKGGVVVGNKYAGSAANLTTLAPAVTGDYAYESDTNELKIVTSGSGTSNHQWTVVANKITAGDGTTSIDNTSKITVGKSSTGGGLSADNISHDALGDSIVLDGASRVSLSANINIDGISKRSGSSAYVSLPAALKIGTLEYDWPSNNPTNGYFLGSDGNRNLKWSIPTVIDSAIAPTTASVLPVGTIVPYVSSVGQRINVTTPAPIPYGWLSCDGSSVNAADYRDLSAVIGISYGGNTTNPDTATTIKLPDLTNRLIYGTNVDNTAGATLYPMASGVGLSAAPLSAHGVNYIIKAVGGVTSPTLTVNKNLSAFVNNVDKTGTAFDFLSGNVEIERPPPGFEVFDSPGTLPGNVDVFVVPNGIHYIKYYVTGSGATGQPSSGGAGATAIGYLSAAPNTVLTLTIGAAPTKANGQSGNFSLIALSGTDLVKAEGGSRLSQAGGTISTSNAHVLNGYVVPGGAGKDAFSGTGRGTSVRGGASFWGSVPAPGGGQTVTGQGTDRGFGTFPGPGIVVLEWN